MFIRPFRLRREHFPKCRTGLYKSYLECTCLTFNFLGFILFFCVCCFFSILSLVFGGWWWWRPLQVVEAQVAAALPANNARRGGRQWRWRQRRRVLRVLPPPTPSLWDTERHGLQQSPFNSHSGQHSRSVALAQSPSGATCSPCSSKLRRGRRRKRRWWWSVGDNDHVADVHKECGRTLHLSLQVVSNSQSAQGLKPILAHGYGNIES